MELKLVITVKKHMNRPTYKAILDNIFSIYLHVLSYFGAHFSFFLICSKNIFKRII